MKKYIILSVKNSFRKAADTVQPFYPGGTDPVPIVQEVRWAPAAVWTGADNLAAIRIRSPDRPALSESLYRLRYRGLPYCRGMKCYLSYNILMHYLIKNQVSNTTLTSNDLEIEAPLI
jgi:hypothetical protein